MTAEVFLAKAEEALAGARREFAAGAYNNCANRCYYACFNAARAALSRAGIGPRGQDPTWGHAFVQSQFAEQLINRRKEYPSHLKNVLSETQSIRITADYAMRGVTQRTAARALGRATEFLAAVQAKDGEP